MNLAPLQRSAIPYCRSCFRATYAIQATPVEDRSVMCAKWLKRNPPESIVARLEASRIKTGNQAGALEFPAVFEMDSMLLSFVDFHHTLPECEQLPIINKAMQAAA